MPTYYVRPMTVTHLIIIIIIFIIIIHAYMPGEFGPNFSNSSHQWICVQVWLRSVQWPQRLGVKPRPHQQQCRSYVRLCCRFREQCRTSFRDISSVRQSRNKLNMFNLFRLCRKDEISSDIFPKNDSNVEATFDFVEAKFDFVERIIRLVASTLLLVWTGLNFLHTPNAQPTQSHALCYPSTKVLFVRLIFSPHGIALPKGLYFLPLYIFNCFSFFFHLSSFFYTPNLWGH